MQPTRSALATHKLLERVRSNETRQTIQQVRRLSKCEASVEVSVGAPQEPPQPQTKTETRPFTLRLPSARRFPSARRLPPVPVINMTDSLKTPRNRPSTGRSHRVQPVTNRAPNKNVTNNGETPTRHSDGQAEVNTNIDGT